MAAGILETRAYSKPNGHDVFVDSLNNSAFCRGGNAGHNLGTTLRRLAWPLRKDGIYNPEKHAGRRSGILLF